MMSGRWQSRHWQASEEGVQPHEARDHNRNREDRRNGRNNEGGKGWHHGREREGGFNRRNIEGTKSNRFNGIEFHHRHHRYPQQHNFNSGMAHQSSWNDQSYEKGKWRRLQPLPQSSSSGDTTRGSKANCKNRSRMSLSLGRERQHHTNQEPLSTTSRNAGQASPTFPASPAQAWSNRSLGYSKANSEKSRPKDREPNGSSKGNDKETEISGKKQHNVWAKHNSTRRMAVASSSTQSTALAPPKATSIAKSPPIEIVKRQERGNAIQAKSPWCKPVLNKKKTSNSDNSSCPSWNALASEKQPSTTLEEHKGTPYSSLPSSSSWGKSQALASAKSLSSGWTKVLTVKEKEAKVEDFPSLLVAQKIPQNQKQHLRPTHATIGAPMTDGNTLKNSNKGSSIKTATPANLATFFSPHLLGSAPAGNQDSKKKQPQSMQSKQPSTTPPKKGNNGNRTQANIGISTLLGTKRSAPPTTIDNMVQARDMLEFPSTGVGKGGVIKKGRQRLTPRKKKLTSLKKRVLKERLRLWKERNGIVESENDIDHPGIVASGEQGLVTVNEPDLKRIKTGAPNNKVSEALKSTTLLVENFIRPEEDDLMDEDEYDEITSDLISMSGRVGKVLSVSVPRPQISAGDKVERDSGAFLETKHVGLAFVRFASCSDACAAKEILDGMAVGGQKIRATIVHSTEIVRFNDNWSEGGSTAPSAEDDRQWRLATLRVMDAQQMLMDESSGMQANSNPPNTAMGESSSAATIKLHKILCCDDYEDEEALQESLDDLKGLAQQYGRVEGTWASTTGNGKGNVYIAYVEKKSAEKAVQQLNGIVVGGSKITVSRNNDMKLKSQPSLAREVLLKNVLNDDDFEDEDCLNESTEDIRKLAQKYGRVGFVIAQTSGEHKGNVHISYVEGHQIAQQAAEKLNGMVVGGLQISASVVSTTENSGNKESHLAPNDKYQAEGNKIQSLPHPPMYSGDKIVPERFAACKRVPKIPNPGKPRSYARKIANEEAVPLLIGMLGELMRLQERSKDDKNARARRRLVMGLREVARGIRAHKVKMVIMANNLDDYGAIDAKLQEILDLARSEDLPIIFELNKRKLGKALGKTIKVSVVGIQNADGTHEEFKKLKKMISMA